MYGRPVAYEIAGRLPIGWARGRSPHPPRDMAADEDDLGETHEIRRRYLGTGSVRGGPAPPFL